MDRATAREIIARSMIPTESGSYMGGLEDQPILARSHGSIVIDTDGKQYLDFQSAVGFRRGCESGQSSRWPRWQ